MSTRVLWRMAAVAGLVLAGLAGWILTPGPRPASAQARGGASGGGDILRMDPTVLGCSMWRVFQTWQTDVAKTESGALVRVDPFDPREKDASGFKLRPAPKIIGSEFPPDDWIKPDFDDSSWQQPPGATRYLYRSLALLCVRGKFNVTDPARAGPLTLALTYHGGVVVYVNGQEVGRDHLPKDKIQKDTLADEYPKEAYTGGGNGLIDHLALYGVQNVEGYSWADFAKVPALQTRLRKLTVTVPASALRRGVNVLALEVHRAPADPVMFTTADGKLLECVRRTRFWWNRAEVLDVKLSAPPGAAGIVANAARPKGYQVWNYPALETVDDMRYGDPNEALQPIRLCGARNGVYSGQVIVSSTDPVSGLRVAVTDLKADGGGSIPAANIQVGYARPGASHWTYLRPNQLDFDVLDPAVAPTIPALKANNPAGVTMQPVWFSVNVPKDAKPGAYAGKVSITAAGQRAVDVPLQFKVVDWTLPDPKDFITYVGIIESPDSVALQYGVEMWSDAHWKLLDKVFAMLAQLGDKEIYIPLVRQSHFGNQHTMVRWIKQGDGSYKPDFTLVEKYLDLAIKHLGKVPMVCAVTTEPNPEHAAGLLFTEMDAKTGELKEAVGPKWGTPESKAFLKPVFDGLRAALTKRGIADSLMVGTHAGKGGAAGPQAKPGMVQDILAVCPGVKWVRVSHYWFNDARIDRSTDQGTFGRIALVGGVLGVFWDPDRDKPIYGWQNPEILITFPRTTNADYAGVRLGQESGLSEHRFFAEAVLTSGRRRPVVTTRGNIAGEMGYDQYKGLRGVGPFGGDFWPVLKGEQSSKNIIGRYGEGYKEGGWGTVSINEVVQFLIAPGKDGPIPTMRSQMMRESLQEAEARVLIQNALLNEASRGRLGADLAKRAADLCYDRTQGMRYFSEFWEMGIIAPGPWQVRSEVIYDVAAQVGKALGK